MRNPTASKLSPALLANIRAQLRHRDRVTPWPKLAKLHKISRRNLMRHVKAVRDGDV